MDFNEKHLLISLYIDGELDKEQILRAEYIINSEPEYKEFYLKYFVLHQKVV